jgi:hypothetical protein
MKENTNPFNSEDLSGNGSKDKRPYSASSG